LEFIDVVAEVERGRSAVAWSRGGVEVRCLKFFPYMYMYLHDNITKSGEHLAH
jgi:hypothetical protein